MPGKRHDHNSRQYPPKMSDSVAQQISLVRSLILTRRLDGAALRIIESIMVSKDVRSSSMAVRLSLRDFIGSESISIMRENADKPVEKKLLDLDFLVRAFALLGDIENCLALRYEALLLREFKSTGSQWLEVSPMEWLIFAEQSLDYGFHSIARKACENALLCFQKAFKTDSETTELFEGLKIIEKINRLKDCAVTSAVSRSVQVQAERYTKSKLMNKSKARPSVCKKTQCLATTLFRNGIRKRNLRYLHESQSFVKMTDEPSTSSN